MESYSQFLDRINGFEKREMNLGGTYFQANSSLCKKVNSDNTFKNFYGDTVVFKLDSAVKNKLEKLVDLLYAAAPECFCQRLKADTYHVTLHDLCSSENFSEVEHEIAANSDAIRQSAWKEYATAKIKFRSNFIFNMVCTSLVLGVCPADEGDYTRITQLYNVIDAIKPLGYPFTPHITLAYFNFNGFNARSAEKLQKIVNRLNGEIQIDFHAQGLYYQHFDSMNRYTDVFRLI